jgi:SPOR domain
MSEGDHRSYGDLAAARSAKTPPRGQPDDPLAGLARLIGQSPWLARDARRPTAAGSRAAREFNPPARHGDVAPDDVLQEKSEEQYSTPEQGSYDFLDWPNGTHDERHSESLPRADVSPQSRSTWYEHEPDAADPQVEASGVQYDDYEDQSHDHSDDRADGEDWDEDLIPPRRGEFTFVAAVFGLALLGTVVAFAFAPFADSIVSSLLSIIKVGGPNKIIQTNTAFQGNVSLQADAEKAGSGERLVPSEDRSADVPPPPVSTPSQPESSAPIFADPTPAPEAGPLAKPAPAARMETLNNPPAVPVPPIPRADQAAAPEAPTLTPASPAERGPKKTDQPNAAGSAASQPQSVPIRPATQEAAKPPERPAPVGKPAATEIASTSPAASGGGYAVQVSSQRNENEVQSSFRTLQAKYPKLLGGREPMVRRADLGAKGIYYRAMVGPFVSAQQANELCSNLKAAGGNCIVQKY